MSVYTQECLEVSIFSCGSPRYVGVEAQFIGVKSSMFLLCAWVGGHVCVRAGG